MKANIIRIKENKYYILYKRILDKNDVMFKYVIYRTNEYGGDIFKEFKYLTTAKLIFNRVSKEAEEHEKVLSI